MDARADAAGVSRGVDTVLAIGSTAVIAYGVLALGWSVFVVMALFWFENVVIGGFNVLRMMVSGARFGAGGVLGAVFMAAFFSVHYGLFTAVHGVFVVMLFGATELGRESMNGGVFGPLASMMARLVGSGEGWIAMAAILAAHAVSFIQWVVATRARPTPLRELMAAPYGRIVVLHVTLIAGGFLIMSLHAPVLGVLLLLVLKLAYDLVALRRGQNAREEPESPAQRLVVADRSTLP
jgi:hypothetical protein